MKNQINITIGEDGGAITVQFEGAPEPGQQIQLANHTTREIRILARKDVVGAYLPPQGSFGMESE